MDEIDRDGATCTPGARSASCTGRALRVPGRTFRHFDYAELLGNQSMLVKEVAEAVGFADPYHFSRVFKRVYGIPPEAFSQTARRHA